VKKKKKGGRGEKYNKTTLGGTGLRAGGGFTHPTKKKKRITQLACAKFAAKEEGNKTKSRGKKKKTKFLKKRRKPLPTSAAGEDKRLTETEKKSKEMN